MAIKTRQTDGTGVTNNNAPLTNEELDTNFIELVAEDATKADLSGATFTGDVTINNNSTSGALKIQSGDNSTGANNRVQVAFGFQETNDYQHFIQTRHNSAAYAGNGIDIKLCDSTQNNTWVSGSQYALSLDGGDLSLYNNSNAVKFFWDSSAERLGIGDTDPEKTLTVRQSANGEVARFVTSTGGSGSIRGDVSIGLSHFANVTHPPVLLEAQEINNGSWLADFHIKTRSVTSDSAPTTRVTVASGGNVGISETNPLVKLDVKGSPSAPATSGTAQTGSLRLSQTAGNGVLDMGFYASATGTSWLQSTSKGNLATNYGLSLNPNGGNVGIGTDDPQNVLHIKTTAANSNAQIRLQNDAVTYIVGPAGTDNDNFNIYSATASATRFSIDTSGDVAVSQRLLNSQGARLHNEPASGLRGTGMNMTNIGAVDTGNLVQTTGCRGIVWTGKHYIVVDATDANATFQFLNSDLSEGRFKNNSSTIDHNESDLFSPHGAAWDGRYIAVIGRNTSSGSNNNQLHIFDLDNLTSGYATRIAKIDLSSIVGANDNYGVGYAEGLYWLRNGTTLWGVKVDLASQTATAVVTKTGLASLTAQAITYDGSHLYMTQNGASMYKHFLSGDLVASINTGNIPDCTALTWNGQEFIGVDYNDKKIYAIPVTHESYSDHYIKGSQVLTAETGAKEVSGVVTIANTTNYTQIATVTGGKLASSVRMAIKGTSANVVIDVVADILVNHSGNIIVRSVSGAYTQIMIAVVSNINDKFDIRIRGTGAVSNTVCDVTIYPLNKETITFTGTATHSTTTHIHTTKAGSTNLTKTGSSAEAYVNDAPVLNQNSSSPLLSGGNTSSYGLTIRNTHNGGPALKLDADGTSGKELWLISNATGNTDGGGRLQFWNETDGRTMATFAGTAGELTKIYNNVQIQNTGNADPVLEIESDSSGTYDPIFRMGSGQNGIADEGFEIWYDNSTGDTHFNNTWDDGALRFHTGTSTAKVATGTSERMVIDKDGKVGIGTGSPSSTLNVVGQTTLVGTVVGTPALNVKRQGSSSQAVKITNEFGDAHTWFCYNDGSNYITGDADESLGSTIIRKESGGSYVNIAEFKRDLDVVFAGEITVNSDERIKKNIEQIDGALEKVQAIRGVTFERVDGECGGGRHAGVIAQEVEKVLPEVVKEGEDGIKSVAYANMVGLLIEAIKEQQTQIDDLKAEVTRLKGFE